MRAFLILTAVALLLVSCGKDDAEQTVSEASADEILLRTASSKLIATFGQQLKGELLAAMNEAGPMGAIEVCHDEAPKIAAANSGEFWTIRRVSDRNRNPDNAANEHEMGVLASFEDTSASSPAHSWAWSETPEGKLFSFYKPIRMAPVCTKCHGGDDVIDADVKAALAEMYPDDRAVGYEAGDLRGMFVVEVEWPEGKAFAESLAGDSL